MASNEEGRMSVSRWSELLPDELLDLIVKKLTRASDYLRFRCVCKSWRSVAKPTNLSPHLPLLMLRYHPSTDRRSVLSVSARQIRTLSIPELVNKVILAASRGWLLLLDVAPADGRLFLLNPLTGSEIQLPPTDGFIHQPGCEFSPVHRNFLRTSPGIDSTLDLLQYSRIFPWRAFLLSSPNKDCMVVNLVIAECYRYHGHVAFCKLGDESWTLSNTGLFGSPLYMAHHEGSPYMTDLDDNTLVCEFAPPLGPLSIDLPDIDIVDLTICFSSQHFHSRYCLLVIV
ncbi:probable F-box protein At1g44080 [Phoenix dactylifera]|uniref:Probable F-box protein At1g44080 n=1 Tax=Phoenix dactylifera TaxID=42345 RepID=A0A8B8ZCI9_PHODC|nr:probable F-box protein At1g44080 [Phoenix dactylifera]